MAEEPLESMVEQVLEMSGLAIKPHRATIALFGRRKIRVWHTIPTGTTPKRSWPGIMLMPGYRDIMMISPDFLARLKCTALTISPRGHWESVEAQDRKFRTNPGIFVG
jgi:hypothetical protein